MDIQDDDLLLRLRRFTPSEDRDPLEDFLTEALGWLLAHHNRLVGALLDRMGLPEVDVRETTWTTQVRTRTGILDMVCSTPERIIVFEHKTYSLLHTEQLVRYRAWEDAQRDAACLVVLITPLRPGCLGAS